MNNINKVAAITTAALALLLSGCSQQQVAGSSQQVAGSSQQVAGSSQQVAGSSQQVAGSSQQVAGSSQQVAGTSQQQAGSQQQQTAPPVEPCKGCDKPVVIRPPKGGHTHPAIPNCTKSVRHNHRGGNTKHSHKYGCRGGRRPTGRPSGGHTHPAIPRCTKSVRHYHKNGKRPHNHKYSCQKRRPAYTPKCRPCRPTYITRKPYVNRGGSTRRHYVKRNVTRYVNRGGSRYVNRGGNRWTHTHPAIPRCTKSIRHTHKYARRNHHHAYSCGGRRAATSYAPRRNHNSVDIHKLQSKLKAKGYYKGPINGVVNPATRSALQSYQQNRR